jgi:predicted SAM-dependent methyltransferase
MKQLNLGSGTDIKEGWINLDIAALPGVDVVHDLAQLPLPFSDNSFDHILAQDILEHLDYIPLLKELHRILKPGGSLNVRVPHFTSRYNFNDPTHKKMFSSKTLDFFVEGASHGRDYYFDFHFSKNAHTQISFERGYYVYNYFVEPIVNISKQTRTVYEATFLCRLFPAGMMEVILIK